MDFFNNYELRREELLARIAFELQLDKTRLNRMESAYNAVYELLKKDEDFFDGVEIELYTQGSKKIGTTVKPINDDDFDLDVVLHIHEMYTKHNPVDIYNKLVKALEKDTYYKEILEKKDRCIRLNYRGDFHMDILPGCLIEPNDLNLLAIPEKKLISWSSANPKGFSEWFLRITKSAKKSLLMRFSEQLILEAKINREELPEDNIYNKTPLQQAVQLIKRNRDIYFQNKDFPVSSIVITTLMGQFYEQQDSIYSTIDGVLSALRNQIVSVKQSGEKFKIVNPVNPDEVFTDSWTDKHYSSFYEFIEDIYSKWMTLKQDFEESGSAYIELFGEGQYKQSLREQLLKMSKLSSDKSIIGTGAILSGTAHTDVDGRINENKGLKNEPHHNFGGAID
jgi:hypothetical protein